MSSPRKLSAAGEKLLAKLPPVFSVRSVRVVDVPAPTRGGEEYHFELVVRVAGKTAYVFEPGEGGTFGRLVARGAFEVTEFGDGSRVYSKPLA